MIFQAQVDSTYVPATGDTWVAQTHFAGHTMTCLAPSFDQSIQGLCNMMARQFDPALQDTGFDSIDLGPGRVEIYVPALQTVSQ